MLLKKMICPNTFPSFMEWCNSRQIYKQIYESLGKPRPNDVSLRDGLQGLSKDEQLNYHLFKKMDIYNEIVENHFPKSLEVGSIVSTSLYPVFKDTIDIHKCIDLEEKNTLYHTNTNIDKYVFIPSYEKFCESIKHNCFHNFSFVSSASNLFLFKNIRQDFNRNYEELSQIAYLLDNLYSKKDQYKTKLYMSCINECPISGKLNNMNIVEQLLQINHLKFDMICLSDTCGTLEPDDFEFIVDKCNELGLPYSKLGLHLHVKTDREVIVEDIIHKALERKIVDFDVSILETGGCSVTIKKENLSPNLSYELYYKSLVNYIIKKSEM